MKTPNIPSGGNLTFAGQAHGFGRESGNDFGTSVGCLLTPQFLSIECTNLLFAKSLA